MKLKEGEYFWWQASAEDMPQLCQIQRRLFSAYSKKEQFGFSHADILQARFFNGGIICEPYWGIFTPAEVTPFRKQV